MRYAQEGLEDLLGIQLIPDSAVKHIELDPDSGKDITKAKKQKASCEHAYARGDTVWYLRSKDAALSGRGMSERELVERGVLMVVLGVIMVEVCVQNLRFVCCTLVRSNFVHKHGKTSEKVIIDGMGSLKLDELKTREHLSKLSSDGWLKRSKVIQCQRHIVS